VAAAAVAGAIDAGFSAGCASGLDVSQTVSGASNLVVSIDTILGQASYGNVVVSCAVGRTDGHRGAGHTRQP
jgi:hypothetical protein